MEVRSQISFREQQRAAHLSPRCPPPRVPSYLIIADPLSFFLELVSGPARTGPAKTIAFPIPFRLIRSISSRGSFDLALKLRRFGFTSTSVFSYRSFNRSKSVCHAERERRGGKFLSLAMYFVGLDASLMPADAGKRSRSRSNADHHRHHQRCCFSRMKWKLRDNRAEI